MLLHNSYEQYAVILYSLFLELLVGELRDKLINVYTSDVPDQSSRVPNTVRMHYKVKVDHKECKKSQNDSFITDLLTLHSADKSIQKIFIKDHNPLKCILIEGISKIGKTFLAKMIAYYWAKDEVLEEFKLLFFVSLGDPDIKDGSCDEFIEYCCRSAKVDSTLKKFILDCNGKNVVFVFDAFNEYQKNSFITDVIKRRKGGMAFCESMIIVTSRLMDETLLHDIAADRRIEVLGVSKEEQKNYISRLFKRELDLDPVIKGLCCVPCHLNALLDLFHHHDDHDDNFPKTLAEINRLFILHVINKNSEDLPEEFIKLAFNRLKSGCSIFTSEISQVCQGIDVSGLMQYTEKRVLFKLHIQEYLAALLIAKCSEEDQESHMHKFIKNDYFKFVWMMYAKMRPKVFTTFINENANEYDKNTRIHMFQCYMQTDCEEESSIFTKCEIESNESWTLDDNNLRDVGMNSLLKYVIKNRKLLKIKIVDLSGNKSSPWGVYCAIIRYCSVNSLTLCGDEGMNEYVEEITDSLQSNTRLDSLTLCKIGRIGVQSINKVLCKSSTLNKVYLSWEKICVENQNRLVHRKFSNADTIVDINVLYSGDSTGHPNKIISLSNKNINDDAVCLIAFGLHENVMVQKLDLSHNEITDAGAKDIDDCLRNNKILQELNLSWNKITSVKAKEDNCKRYLHKLDISCNHISNCGTFFTDDYPVLKEINLSGNKIKLTDWNMEPEMNEEQTSESRRVREQTSELRHVNLSENIDDSKNISSPWSIYCAIIERCRVDSLTLCGCHDFNKFAEEVTKSFKKNARLQSLTLHHIVKNSKVIYRKQTVIQGTLKVSEIVEKSIVIVLYFYDYDIEGSCKIDEQDVNLSGRNLNNDSIQLLALGLYNNTTVTKLDISCNSFTVDGVNAISNCLKSNSTLCEINLSNNKIDKKGAKEIGEALQNNATVQKLDMAFNNICNEGAMAIGDCIENTRAWCKNCIKNKLTLCEGCIKNYHALCENCVSIYAMHEDSIKNYSALCEDYKPAWCEDCVKNNHTLCEDCIKNNLALCENCINSYGALCENCIKIDHALCKDCIKGNRVLREDHIKGNHMLCEDCVKSNCSLCEDCIKNYHSLCKDCIKGYSALCEINVSNNKIEDEGAIKIARALVKNSTLQKLDMSHNKITDKGVMLISECLKSNTTLKELNLLKNRTTVKGLGEMVKVKTGLQKLYFSVTSVTDDEVSFVENSFVESSILHTLDLSGNDFTCSTKAKIIPSIVKLSKGLHELNVSQSSIAENSIEIVSECLPNRTLQILKMQHNYITGRGVKIAQFVQNSTLQHLDLSSNHVDDEGAKVISDYLQSNTCSLHILNLSRNQITSEGAIIIANAIQMNMNTTLEELDISYNSIKDEGMKAISIQEKCSSSEATRIKLIKLYISKIGVSVKGIACVSSCLIGNCTLQVLDVSNNSITSSGAERIASALKQNQSLISLDISCNEIGDDGVKFIGSCLNSTVLQELNLSENCITTEGIRELVKAIEHNTKLQKLNLSKNDICENRIATISDCLKLKNSLQEVIMKNI